MDAPWYVHILLSESGHAMPESQSFIAQSRDNALITLWEKTGREPRMDMMAGELTFVPDFGFCMIERSPLSV